MIEIGFEIFRAAVLVAVTALLCREGLGECLPDARGWSLVIAGFGLLSLSSIVDPATGVEGIVRFVGTGDSKATAIAADVAGFPGGFILVALGFARWIPRLRRLSDGRASHRESEQELTSSPDIS